MPGFQDAVRGVILDAYARTCQSVSKAALADSLRLDGAAIDQLVRPSASQALRAASQPSADSQEPRMCDPASPMRRAACASRCPCWLSCC